MTKHLSTWCEAKGCHLTDRIPKVSYTLTNTLDAVCDHCSTLYHHTERQDRKHYDEGIRLNLRVAYCPECGYIPNNISESVINPDIKALYTEIQNLKPIIQKTETSKFGNVLPWIDEITKQCLDKDGHCGYLIKFKESLIHNKTTNISRWYNISPDTEPTITRDSKSNEPIQLNLKISKKDLSNPKGTNITITPI